MLAALGQVEMEAHWRAHRLWAVSAPEQRACHGCTAADRLHEAQWNQRWEDEWSSGQVWEGSSGDLHKASNVLKESLTLSTFYQGKWLGREETEKDKVSAI